MFKKYFEINVRENGRKNGKFRDIGYTGQRQTK